MVRVVQIGDVPPQSTAVAAYLSMAAHIFGYEYGQDDLTGADLLVVAGHRSLIPADVLAIPRLGTVGFHSAKLPEYPGRAPVPWTLLRGDKYAYNTLLFLDDGVDTGDIIDERSRPIAPRDTPESIYAWVARTDVEMLAEHLPALLAGTAPRRPQDLSLRGPVTRADGWQRWAERCASSV